MLCGGSRSGAGRCFPVFPKVDAASPRGLMAPPGLRPWAPRVLSGTGCRLPDGLRAPALGSYIVSLRWRGTAPSAPFLMPPLAAKTFTTALQARKCIPPFGGWRHHLARWEACHWIRGSRGSPMNPVPLPTPQAGALWVLSNGAMSLQESIERFILSPGWGKVRRSRIRGSRAAANHQNADQAL